MSRSRSFYLFGRTWGGSQSGLGSNSGSINLLFHDIKQGSKLTGFLVYNTAALILSLWGLSWGQNEMTFIKGLVLSIVSTGSSLLQIPMSVSLIFLVNSLVLHICSQLWILKKRTIFNQTLQFVFYRNRYDSLGPKCFSSETRTGSRRRCLDKSEIWIQRRKYKKAWPQRRKMKKIDFC